MDPVIVEETGEQSETTAATTTLPPPRTKVASVAIIKDDMTEQGERKKMDVFGRERKVVEESVPSNSVPAEKGRNKRLFGALMGHLSQAKQNLDKDSTLIEKRMAVESKRVAKHEELNTTLCQLEREMVDAQRCKERTHRRLDTLQWQKNERKVVLEAWCVQTAPLAHVLMTETEPKLCWLPSSHNATTQNLLNVRTAQIQAMIQSRVTEEETKREEIDTEIASLEAILAASTASDNHNHNNNTSEEAEQVVPSVTLSEYEARIKRRRAERETEAALHPPPSLDLREETRSRKQGHHDPRSSQIGPAFSHGYAGSSSSSSSSSDGGNRNGKHASKNGQFGGDLRELLGTTKSTESREERRGHHDHNGGEVEVDEEEREDDGQGRGRSGRSGESSGGSVRRVRQSIAEDEEGEELDDKDRGKEDREKEKDGGEDKDGVDKEEGEGDDFPVYWSQPASAVTVGNRHDESDEDVERYFAE